MALVRRKRSLIRSTLSAELIDVASGSLLRQLDLGRAGPASQGTSTECTFSPDSQWVLVTSLLGPSGGVVACLSCSQPHAPPRQVWPCQLLGKFMSGH